MMKGHTGDLIAMISHRTGARIVGTAGKHKYTLRDAAYCTVPVASMVTETRGITLIPGF